MTDTDHYCLSAHRCADTIDGHPRGTEAPNTFCDACLARTVKRVQGLPEQYIRLHHIIGERHAGIDAGIMRPKPGSVIPLNIHVDTLLGDIVFTIGQAAEILAEMMAMDNPEHHPEAKQVAACAKIIAPNIEKLLPLTGLDVMFWNRSGNMHGFTNACGVAIVLRLDHLATLAHFTLGLTRARYHRDLPCTRCSAKTIGRWAGSEDYDCERCGSRFIENDIRRQDKILVAQLERGVIEVPDPDSALQRLQKLQLPNTRSYLVLMKRMREMAS
jgi:hypothetical protein